MNKCKQSGPIPSLGQVTFLLCSCICCFWWALPAISSLLDKAEDRRYKAQVTPPALPTKRRRRLTGSSSPPSSKKKKIIGLFPKIGSGKSKGPSQTSSSSQASSSSSFPFLKLIPELRLMIYKEFLSDYIIHIHLERGGRKRHARLAHSKCKPISTNNGFQMLKDQRLGLKHTAGCTLDEQKFFQPTDHSRGDQFLALTKTCRQIYTETIDLVYSSNTFSIVNDDRGSLFFPTILPSRKDAIQSLQLDYLEWPWSAAGHVHEEFWDTVCQMKSLRHLYVGEEQNINPLPILQRLDKIKKGKGGEYAIHIFTRYDYHRTRLRGEDE